MATLKTILARLGDRANTADPDASKRSWRTGGTDDHDTGPDGWIATSRDRSVEHDNATYDFDAGWNDVYDSAGVDQRNDDSEEMISPTRRWVWRHVIPDPEDLLLVALAAFGFFMHAGWLIVATVAGLAYSAWWRRSVPHRVDPCPTCSTTRSTTAGGVGADPEVWR
jgi:hypothetical protein